MKKRTLFITLSILLVCTHLYGQINRERQLYEKGIENNPVNHPKEETVVDSLVSPNSLSHTNIVS